MDICFSFMYQYGLKYNPFLIVFRCQFMMLSAGTKAPFLLL